jgi:hypothetical protein
MSITQTTCLTSCEEGNVHWVSRYTGLPLVMLMQHKQAPAVCEMDAATLNAKMPLPTHDCQERIEFRNIQH